MTWVEVLISTVGVTLIIILNWGKNNISNYKDFKRLFTTTAILHTDNQEKSDELKLENPVTPENKIDV